MPHTIALSATAGASVRPAITPRRVGATAPSRRATAAVFDWIDAAEAAQRIWARNMLLAIVAATALAWLLSRVVDG